MAEDSSNKTEQPTPKRLSEAYEKGNFARAPDLQMVGVLLASVWSIAVLGRHMVEQSASIAVGIFGHLGTFAVRPEAATPWTAAAVSTLLKLLLPISGACLFASVLIGGVQSGFRITPKALSLNLDRLNPVVGFQRIFSSQGLMRVLLDAMRILVVAWVIWSGVDKVMFDPIFRVPVPLPRLGEFLADASMILLWRCVLALGVIAAFNYLYQWQTIRGQLMMTKQEVRDEMKQTEGDPKIKSALRALARRILQRQMLKSLETADVVVTNPVHFAVALRYDRENESAPVVVARGEQAFARRIKAVAAQLGVPIVENPPVARMLYKFGAVGKPIPGNLYRAVAEILAFVYRTYRDYFRELNRRRRGF
jgi:flagellar biosynthetic protein FlhB